MDRDPNLLQVVNALNSPGGLARRLYGGQKQGDQQSDDCNDDEKFDQSESATYHWGGFSTSFPASSRHRERSASPVNFVGRRLAPILQTSNQPGRAVISCSWIDGYDWLAIPFVGRRWIKNVRLRRSFIFDIVAHMATCMAPWTVESGRGGDSMGDPGWTRGAFPLSIVGPMSGLSADL
jgi:hypothetical protein